MESTTKNRQPITTLREIIARAYGPDSVPTSDDFAVELHNGWFNVAYVLTLVDGHRVVLKIAPARGIPVMTYETDLMHNELTALALVQQHTTVPVPPVDFSDLSGEIIDVPWFVMPFIDAEVLNIQLESGALSPAEIADYNERLGALNRELNTITGPHFGPLAGPGYTTWRDAFAAMIEDVLRDGEHLEVDLGWPYSAVRDVVAANLDALDEVTEPRFVEWDLWAGNVMVRGGRISAILDHERAFYGDPLIENGFVPLDLGEPGSADAFMRGYGHPPLTPTQSRRRRLYTLYLILIMVIETKYREHDDPAQYTWARTQLNTLMTHFAH